MKMAEEARLAGESPYLAILYDDLLRKTVSERAKRRDPELDLDAEFVKVNKEIFQLAKSRLAHVLSAAGVTSERPSSSSGGRSFVGMESALAKQAAAADALTKKAEAAAKALARQQQEMDKRAATLRSPAIDLNNPKEDGGKRKQRWAEFKAGKKKAKGGKGSK